MPIEVELTQKSKARLRAVLGAARRVGHGGQDPAGDLRLRERRGSPRGSALRASSVGLCADAKRRRKTLRVELLEDIREQALAARRTPSCRLKKICSATFRNKGMMRVCSMLALVLVDRGADRSAWRSPESSRAWVTRRRSSLSARNFYPPAGARRVPRRDLHRDAGSGSR